ncbi:MAG TPA: RNA methyltransferase [Rectinemataceae bacterium]|nr:RNA methyltransferase [Rectinemataceae bacterium]
MFAASGRFAWDEDKDCLVLEGAFLVERALRAGLELLELFAVPARESWLRSLETNQAGIAGRPERSWRSTILPEPEIAAMAGYPFHRGVLARARRPPEIDCSTLANLLAGKLTRAAARGEGRSTLLALPELRDPANAGSLFRSAAALGCDGLLIRGGLDLYARRVLRTSMGASFMLPWARLGSPDDLAVFDALGFQRAACVLGGGAADLRDFERPPRLLLVFGDEAYGLAPIWREACQHRLTLPMESGMDSLNVAVAAAIFLYALR